MRLLRIFLLLAAAFPGVTLAQTASVLTVQPTSGARTISFNKGDCEGARTTTVTVTYNQTVVPTAAPLFMQAFLTTTTSCDSVPTSADQIIVTSVQLNATNRSQSGEVRAARLGSADSASCTANKTLNWTVCANIHQKGTDTTGKANDIITSSASLAISYDSEPPRAAQITQIAGGEKSLFFNWTGEDVSSWTVYYRPVGQFAAENADPCAVAGTTTPDAGNADAGEPAEFLSAKISEGTVRSGSLTELVNDQQYEVFMVATDAAGNDSPDGNHVFGTPRAVADFYKRYRCAGGDETGGFGCSSAVGGVTAASLLAAALALTLLRRRA